MKIKHIAIDILPRLIWAIQGGVLFFVHHYINYQPRLTDNLLLLIFGCSMMFSGTFCIIWVSRFLTKAVFTRELVVEGPYKYARHPMYVAIYIILIGVGLLFFSIPWFVILLAFVPIWYIDCQLEEKQMTDLHQQEYLDYKRRVGMFFSFRF